MQSIRALENDIVSQIEYLHNFKPQKPIMSNHTIFSGSGDSLVSAMMAECFSNYSTRAIDPLDLIKNKALLKNKHVYYISISGNTISNIKAAKSTKKSTAITKNSSSRLANICNQTILLNYDDSGILTSGSIGFLASMLTCISLICKFHLNAPDKLFNTAKNQSKKISLKNKIFFLGNQYTYPLCMYASAKLYEISGLDSKYEKIEQFSHMGLFSAKRGDTVIIFENPNTHNKKLASSLNKLGLNVYNPSTTRNGKIDLVLFYTFVSQFLALNHAKKKRQQECHFITEKKFRNVSSSMIY